MSSFTCLPITCQFANMWISAFRNLHKFTHGAVQDLAAMKQKRKKCINGCAKRKGNWFQNINDFMIIWTIQKWLLNLRLLVRFRTGKNRCNSVSITGSHLCKSWNRASWFRASTWALFFLGKPKKQLQRLGTEILTESKMQRMRHWLMLVKCSGGFSISYTACFTPGLLTPGCGLALWNWFWLKQIMFLTHGCVKIQVELEGLSGLVVALMFTSGA